MTETHLPNSWPQPYRLLDAQPYWDALADEKLTYQRCTACRESVWPAHSFCTHCGAKSLDWAQSSGRGEIYSFSTITRGPTPVWAGIVPYTVGFIRMDEGYFLFSQIDEAPEAIRIGQRVEVRFVQRGEQKLPVFVLSKQ
ncbi:Zn-ribbon domain-containing OB-fold protein [Burkholderia contaminans]|uniref:Zn-ribbon domain-containing OB-fold protein n=1 Tax=Burkholderia contaminans TaxID=488447 RepID=UPI00158A7A67|nr:OB-fold domain-containing protein [Burkholderia contaminans]